MTEPMRIRAQMKGDIAEIRVMVMHPMENGKRKGNDGKLVAPHFMQQFSVEVGGKLVIQEENGTALSLNPVFAFKVKGAKAGEKVVMKWSDSNGESRTDEVTIG